MIVINALYTSVIDMIKYVLGNVLNLPGWRWARIMQLALVGSSSSSHSEVCKALGGSSGVVHSTISGCDDTRTRGCHDYTAINAFYTCVIFYNI